MLHSKHLLFIQNMKYTEKNVLLSIAGRGAETLLSKIKELDHYKIDTAALFLTMAEPAERKQVYIALQQSNIKHIPFVHLRNDMSAKEVEFLEKNFKPTYYNMHEAGFRYYHKWQQIQNKLYLELSGSGQHEPKAEVERVAGFCIDLAHYKVGEVSNSPTFQYLTSKRKQKSLFVCNHLNGYDDKNNICDHQPKLMSQLAYLKDVPPYVFGGLIALEMENSIKQQLVLRPKILKLLSEKFN